ncbi:hypothetical protein JZY91_00380 [Corynebacterium sp. CNCTC7651]|nr:hypothetical protein [Corynebacterium sp. CNCTC7651]UIZ92315.1 hypothetical protein JZY91_00380 [Corynebacterium sp. CNCTC7651]
MQPMVVARLPRMSTMMILVTVLVPIALGLFTVGMERLERTVVGVTGNEK